MFFKAIFKSFFKNNIYFEGTDFYGRCWDANTFPARKCTPEPNVCFSQTSDYLL